MTKLSDRTIERILQTEPDEAKAQEAINRLLKLKEEVGKYIEEHFEE